MKKLLEGIHRFQRHVFSGHEPLLRTLVERQQPEVLFITCSDSRLDPAVLMQAAPGDLFVLRNAGNIVPAHGTGTGGEAATIEFALEVLGVRHIVVCGHSHCGAMAALMDPPQLAALPATAAWLRLAEGTRAKVLQRCEAEGRGDPPADELTDLAVEENVLGQIESLRTHPAVARRLENSRLHLHGWMYRFETGEMFCFRPDSKRFEPLDSAHYLPSV